MRKNLFCLSGFVLTGFFALLLLNPSLVLAAGTIILNPSTRYQTITGWEATTQAGQALEVGKVTGKSNVNPAFATYSPGLFDRLVNELGITRLRVEVGSGAENTTDYYQQFITGQIPFEDKIAQKNPVNDDADPFSVDAYITQNPTSANILGFKFTALDDKISKVMIPVKQRVQARGDKFFMNVNFVDFRGISPGTFVQYANADEYAEFVLATYQHIKNKYGFTPDSWEVILEPDNTSFNGTRIGQAVAAASPRLRKFGFTPHFILPSVTNMDNALPYYNAAKAVLGDTGIKQNVIEISYHRYGGLGNQTTTLPALATEARRLGIGTAMLERIGAGFNELHNDVKNGGNVAWQRYIIGDYWLCGPTCSDGKYYDIDMGTDPLNNPNLNPIVTINTASKQLSQYMNYIRPGMVRIGLTDPSGLDSMAFVSPSGRYVVVVRTSSANHSAFSVAGLPAGTYGISYVDGSTLTSANAWRANFPDQTVATGGILTVPLKTEALVSIYGKTGGNPLPPPPPPAPSPVPPPPPPSPVPPPPAPAPTPPPPSGPVVGNGDVNKDNAVNLTDLVLIVGKWLGVSSTPGSNEDQYGDRRINAMDFAVAAGKIASAIVPPPAPSPSPSPVPSPSAGVASCMRYNISLRRDVLYRGEGRGFAQVDTVNNKLSYQFDYKYLSGPATAAHIHGFTARYPASPAPALHTITIPAAAAGAVNGVWTYPEADEANILKGLSYINIHTAQYPNGEISGWLDGGVACIPAGMTTLPACPTHDPTKYHGLIDPVRNCHYNHEHKENPHDADDVCGTPGKWWSDMYTLIGQTVPAQEISYPWLTANGLENLMYKDASGNIIGGKHESYGIIVRKGMTIAAGQPKLNDPARQYVFIKDFRIQTHMDTHSQGTQSRYHSYMIEGRLCLVSNPTDCGIMRLGGHGDYEELNVDHVHVPLPNDPPIPANQLQGSISRRDHESKTRGTRPLDQNIVDWYMVRKSEYKVPRVAGDQGDVKGTPFGYTTFNFLTLDAFTTTDRNAPSAANVVCPNFQCPLNNSTVEFGRFLEFPYNPPSYRDSTNHINFRGFTDHYGNELPGACSTPGCTPTTKCTAGPDCVPMEAIHLPVAEGSSYEDRRAGIVVREYDTSPAAVGLGTQWWIEFPN